MLEADENFPLDFRWGNSCRSWFVYSLCNSNVEDTLDGYFLLDLRSLRLRET